MLIAIQRATVTKPQTSSVRYILFAKTPSNGCSTYRRTRRLDSGSCRRNVPDRATIPVTPRRGVIGQGEGPVDDDLLAQRGGHDVEGAAERRKHVGVDELADRPEPVAFADQRDPAAQDDPPRGEQGDSLPQGEGQGPLGPIEDCQGLGISVDRGPGDQLGRDRRQDLRPALLSTTQSAPPARSVRASSRAALAIPQPEAICSSSTDPRSGRRCDRAPRDGRSRRRPGRPRGRSGRR